MTGKKLKKVREFLQLNQSEFAKLIGIKAKNGLRTVRRYETGESPIPGSVELVVQQIMQDKGMS